MQSGPWPRGINNRQDQYALPDGSVFDAVNVNLDASGYAHRRYGYSKAINGVMAHSGWSGIGNAFYVTAGVLNRINADLSLTPIYSGISDRVSYCEIGDTVYLSDGHISLSVTGNTASTWGAGAAYADDRTITAPPPGRIVRHYRGRIYIASGQFIHYTEPMAYEWYRGGANFIPFPEPVTIMEPVDGGLWVVADKTYFLSGATPESFTVSVKGDFGAAFGTEVTVVGGFGPDKLDGVIWHSDRGAVLGTNQGQLIELQTSNASTHTAESGIGFLREHDGMRQYIVSLNEPKAPALATTGWLQIV
jgi:hypothetical protein